MGDREDDIRRGTLVQAMLKDIGITVELETLESATHNARRASGDWDLRHQGYNTLTADILSYFWHPVRASNFDGINDPVFTDLLDKARHRLDEERRRANETLVRYTRDHALHVPLLNPRHDAIVSKRVVGVKVHKNSMDWILNDAWLRE